MSPDRHPKLAERLVMLGGVVFLVGLLTLGLTLALFAQDGRAPAWIAALALLPPIGLAISFAGLVVQIRQRRD